MGSAVERVAWARDELDSAGRAAAVEVGALSARARAFEVLAGAAEPAAEIDDLALVLKVELVLAAAEAAALAAITRAGALRYDRAVAAIAA